YTALKESFGWKPEKHIKDLIYWADVIDGAQYKDPLQTIVLKEPALEIAAFVDRNDHSEKEASALIKKMAVQSIAEIAKLKKIKKAAASVRKENLKTLTFYKKNLKVFGDATFIDLTGTKLHSLRFAPYYLHPKLMYAIRLTH